MDDFPYFTLSLNEKYFFFCRYSTFTADEPLLHTLKPTFEARK